MLIYNADVELYRGCCSSTSAVVRGSRFRYDGGRFWYNSGSRLRSVMVVGSGVTVVAGSV